jgi:hypothetical protein
MSAAMLVCSAEMLKAATYHLVAIPNILFSFSPPVNSWHLLNKMQCLIRVSALVLGEKAMHLHILLQVHAGNSVCPEMVGR